MIVSMSTSIGIPSASAFAQFTAGQNGDLDVVLVVRQMGIEDRRADFGVGRHLSIGLLVAGLTLNLHEGRRCVGMIHVDLECAPNFIETLLVEAHRVLALLGALLGAAQRGRERDVTACAEIKRSGE